MKKISDFYDEKYTKIAIYVSVTALFILIMGMIIISLSHTTGNVSSFIGAILSPLLLGFVLAYLLSPIVEKLEEKVFYKTKRKHVLAVIGTFVIVLLAVQLILVILVFTITRSIKTLDFQELLALFTQDLETDLNSFWGVAESFLAGLNIDIKSFTPKVSQIFGSISSFFSSLLFANIFAIYFLLDDSISTYWADVYRLFVPADKQEKISELLKDLDTVFSGYIRGQSLDALCIGLMVGVLLTIAGIPYGMVIGLLTGVGNLIPYVGGIVGFGSLIIVCLSEGSITHLIVGGVLLAIAMAIDSNVINPRLLSHNVEIHPALVTVALIAGGNIGGLVGMLIAVPTAAFLKLQFDKFVEKRRRQLEAQEKPKKKTTRKTK